MHVMFCILGYACVVLRHLLFMFFQVSFIVLQYCDKFVARTTYEWRFLLQVTTVNSTRPPRRRMVLLHTVVVTSSLKRTITWLTLYTNPQYSTNTAHPHVLNVYSEYICWVISLCRMLQSNNPGKHLWKDRTGEHPFLFLNA